MSKLTEPRWFDVAPETRLNLGFIRMTRLFTVQMNVEPKEMEKDRLFQEGKISSLQNVTT
jgi:hypothetical protein